MIWYKKLKIIFYNNEAYNQIGLERVLLIRLN